MTDNIKTPEYVDSGGFGCVFRPSIPCPGKKQKNNTISKVFKEKSDSDKEWYESKIIKEIDKNNKFTLSPIDYCKITRKDIKNINSCGYKWSMLNSWPQIIYPDGGISLHSQKIQNYNFLDLLNSLTPIIDGLIIIKNKGYCHHDIKPLNIVYNHSKNKSSLIDFGLLEPLKNIYKKSNYSDLQHRYIYKPPEHRLYSYYVYEKNIFINNSDINYIANHIEYDGRHQNHLRLYKLLQLIYPQTYKKFDIYVNHPIKNIEDMINTMIPKIQNLNYSDLNNLFYKSFSPKIDIFSMGISVLEIFITFFSNKISELHYLDKNDKRLLLLIINWIYKARHNNVYERYTNEEASIEWHRICNKLNKYSKSSASKSFKSLMKFT